MITIIIDPRDRSSVLAGLAVAEAVARVTNLTTPEEGQTPMMDLVKPAPVAKKPAAKKAEAPAPAPVATEEPAPVQTTEEPEGITLQGLRAVLAEKVDAHRDEILAKLKGFKAGNMTTLDPAHYPAMYHFLTSLS